MEKTPIRRARDRIAIVFVIIGTIFVLIPAFTKWYKYGRYDTEVRWNTLRYVTIIVRDAQSKKLLDHAIVVLYNNEEYDPDSPVDISLGSAYSRNGSARFHIRHNHDYRAEVYLNDTRGAISPVFSLTLAQFRRSIVLYYQPERRADWFKYHQDDNNNQQNTNVRVGEEPYPYAFRTVVTTHSRNTPPEERFDPFYGRNPTYRAHWVKYVVRYDSADLREYSTADSKLIRTLQKGEEVGFMNEIDDRGETQMVDGSERYDFWTKVQTAGGQTGWIFKPNIIHAAYYKGPIKKVNIE